MPAGWTCLPSTRPLRLLVLGAHSDDIEIGCGGTILTWLESGVRLDVTWVVFAARGEREDEATRSAAHFLAGASEQRIVTHGFTDSFFPRDWSDIKTRFEDLKEVRPDVILTHYRDDRHQDHRVVSDLTWNTFRAHAIFEYEIPKYDGDLGTPNVFVPLTRDVCEAKATALLTHFPTQAARHWFDRETFMSLARLRGMEAACEEGYAEAFYSRKLTLRMSPGGLD